MLFIARQLLNLLRRTFWDFGGFTIQNSVAQRGWIPTLPNSLLPLFWCMAYLQTYMHRPFPFLKCRWNFHHFIYRMNGWTDEHNEHPTPGSIWSQKLRIHLVSWAISLSARRDEERKWKCDMWQIQWFHMTFLLRNRSLQNDPKCFSNRVTFHLNHTLLGGHPVLMMYRRLPIFLLQNGPPNSQDLIAIHLRKWAAEDSSTDVKALLLVNAYQVETPKSSNPVASLKKKVCQYICQYMSLTMFSS